MLDEKFTSKDLSEIGREVLLTVTVELLPEKNTLASKTDMIRVDVRCSTLDDRRIT